MTLKDSVTISNVSRAVAAGTWNVSRWFQPHPRWLQTPCTHRGAILPSRPHRPIFPDISTIRFLRPSFTEKVSPLAAYEWQIQL